MVPTGSSLGLGDTIQDTGVLYGIDTERYTYCMVPTLLEGGVVLPVARHLEAPDFVQNVLESVAEELDLRPPRRPLLRPFQLHGLACSDSQ